MQEVSEYGYVNYTRSTAIYSELLLIEENIKKIEDQDYTYSFEEENRGSFTGDSRGERIFFNTQFLLVQFCNKISKIIYKLSDIIKPVCEIDFE